MPTIRPSADLRNSYNEISEFCHEYSEPVFITKNGKGDLIEKGLEDERKGKVRPLAKSLKEIREGLSE